MSTNRSSSSGKNNNNKQTGRTGQSKPVKKKRSVGFIETSGFKPNWLETGPLTPEILRDSLPPLEREAPSPEETSKQVVIDPVIAEPSQDESVLADIVGVERPITDEITPETPAAETGVDAPSSLEEQPEAWVQNLFDSGNDQQSTGAMAATIVEETWVEPAAAEHHEFIVEAAEEIASEAIAVASTAPVAIASARETKRPARAPKVKTGGRWTPALLMTGLLLLGLAALTLFINPFIRLAMNSGTVALPAAASAVAPPQSGSGDWCVSGDFLGGGETLRLADGGSQGDILVNDSVFSLNHVVAQPGTYRFQVVDCNNTSLAFPETAAWLKTSQPNQQITFVFDASGRGASLFGATPYVVSAIDGTTNFRAIGSFQNWDESDTSSTMGMISDGLFQQVRRIALPGNYEARFQAEDSSQSIDAFGRTDDPVSLNFATTRNGEPVVFLLDTDRGQASVLYDMSPLLTSLAFGNGYRWLSYGLIGLAGLLLLLMALRLYILHNDRLRMEHGCPQCGQQELMRISRRSTQRIQNMLGIPAYRYRCRNCTWEGTRLSDMGEAVSPGALFTRVEGY